MEPQRSSALVALVLSIIVHSVLHAQPQPRDYNFYPLPHRALHSFWHTSTISGDETVMSCEDLAANNYGQWAVNSQGQWVLWSNDLQDADATDPSRVVPSGIVELGGFLESPGDNITAPPAPGAVRVACNLHGSVRYVWPNSYPTGGTGFVIEGFDDKETNLDPEISFDLTGFPGALRTVLRKPIHIFPLTTQSVANNGLDLNTERVAHDMFDVAMDYKFLYIAWGTPQGIYVSAFDITTGLQVTGWPRLMLSGDTRPTIACDVRNNPTSPTFDVCGIAMSGANVEVRWCLNGMAQAVLPLVDPYSIPTVPMVALPYHSTLVTRPYGPVSHARVVVSSVATPDEMTPHTTAKCVYVYAQTPGDPSGYQELVFERYVCNPTTLQTTRNNYGTYVKGPLMSTHPAPWLPNGLGALVIDQPVVAFANPYDAQNSSAADFEEFHCVYRAEDQVTPDHWREAAMIVRADRNGQWGAAKTDSRVILNREFVAGHWEWVRKDEPQSRQEDASVENLFGAANQMGIHTRWWWTQSGSNWYNRDTRDFDEPIEENTIVSHDCSITDGSAHGGTRGAPLLPNREILLWTDPNAGLETGSQGVYVSNTNQPLHWFNACLKLVPDGATFEVGAEAANGGATERLVMMPNALFEFGGDGQTLRIGTGGWLDYYGIPNPNTSTNFIGAGHLSLSAGWWNWNPQSQLNGVRIHGGARFELSENVPFDLFQANIVALLEPSVATAHEPPVPNSLDMGIAVFHGHATMEQFELYFDAQSDVQKDLIVINPCLSSSLSNCEPRSNTQFRMTDGGIYTYGSGYARILAKGTTSSTNGFGGIDISGLGAMRTDVDVQNPISAVSVVNSTFENVDRKGISVTAISSGAYSAHDYTSLLISGNAFRNPSPNSYGIFVEGLSDAVKALDVSIVNNDFTYPNPLEIEKSIAVHTKGVEGFIGGNVVDGYVDSLRDSGYKVGIEAADAATFICGNVVRNVIHQANAPIQGYGISTSNWSGFAKLNEVTGCEVAHHIDGTDHGNILFSKYWAIVTGIYVQSASSRVNMDGSHTGGDDYASFDTVRGIRSVFRLYGNPEGNIVLGDGSGATSGRNNLLTTESSGVFCNNEASYPVTLGDVGSNYWSVDDGTTPYALPSSPDPARFVNSTYASSSYDGSWNAAPFQVECGGGFTTTEVQATSPRILSLDEDSCSSRFQRIDRLCTSNSTCFAGYDSAKQALRECYAAPNSCGLFSSLSAAAVHIGDNAHWLDLQNFIKESWGWNKADCYFCTSLLVLAFAFERYDRPNYLHNDYNGEVAILDFILASSRCPSDSSGIYSRRKSVRYNQWLIWQDTVKDSLATPLDTASVTLESRGLGYLRSGVAGMPYVGADPVESFTALRNPSDGDVTLILRTRSQMTAMVEVFDALGRTVWSSPMSAVDVEAKQYDAHLGSVRGIYYARLSTPSGVSRTIKLSHK